MNNIFILTGLPGSGKSTWSAKKAFNLSCIVISRDSIRSMIGGNGKYVHEKFTEPVVKQMACAAALAALNEGFDVIIDECTPRKDGREFWKEALGSNYKYTLVYFPEKKRNLELRMNDSRGLKREYWERVISGMTTAYEVPDEKEKSEYNEFLEVVI